MRTWNPVTEIWRMRVTTASASLTLVTVENTTGTSAKGSLKVVAAKAMVPSASRPASTQAPSGN
jgi:hypothetical protein